MKPTMMNTMLAKFALLMLAFVAVGTVSATAQDASSEAKGKADAIKKAVENKTQPASTAATPAAQSETGKKGGGPARAATARVMRGSVVNYVDLLSGGTGKVTAQQAQSMSDKSALAVMIGSGRSGKLYLIIKSDGKSAGDDLARLADSPIALTGKMMTRNGLNMIFADGIDAAK
jgi:hypothetical protein